MRQQVYIIYNEYTKDIADKIADSVFVNKMVVSEDLTLFGPLLFDLAKETPTEYFYVITCQREMSFPDFNFTYIPSVWDKDYVHLWNNDPSVQHNADRDRLAPLHHGRLASLIVQPENEPNRP
jgi:hypothetical protein